MYQELLVSSDKRGRPRQQQSGFATMLVFAVIVLVVLILGYAGYHAVKSHAQDTSAATAAFHSAATFTSQSADTGQPPTQATQLPSNTNPAPVSTASNSSNATANSPRSALASPSTTSTPASVSPSTPIGNTTTQGFSETVTQPSTIDSGTSGHIYLLAGCTGPRKCLNTIRAYQAMVVVESANGQAVTSFTSDSEGNFLVTLEPGTYLLVPSSYGSGKITASDQTITVTAHRFTPVSIQYKQSF